MNAQQMIIGVNLGLQKINSNAFDNFQQEEILYYLNKAGREYVRRQHLYLKNDISVSREDVITDLTAFNNLRTIVSSITFTGGSVVPSPEYDNAVLVDITTPAPMFSLINVTVATPTGRRQCVEISHNDIGVYMKTSYNDPLFRKYPFIMMGNTVTVFYDYDGGSIDSLLLNYLRSPSTLVVSESPGPGEVTTHELPEHTHDDIVDLAVAIMSEDIKSARPYEQNQKTIKGAEQ